MVRQSSKWWSESGTVEYNGFRYPYRAGLVDTDYGPEMRVEIHHLGCGDPTWKYQEPASVETILEWWREELKNAVA